ncbi:paraquat-inducible protein A [Albidovulum sediminicola]|uniref:Paraquat-inducible protein A n=1 Tax=Albidovulum sediminicola TaxID=2984331 RepID=A0ABT2YX83_9RHOB|nr:paraquat-inducible protein A [Defluviimonas sp. WL0075]MCV2863479.1 paraquat-inducible protein A [Defluviimonas sp. WL0075]
MEDARGTPAILTARRAGLVGCTRCGRVHSPRESTCRRCGSALTSRDGASLQRVWAWLMAGMIAYVPAMTFPMLMTTTLGQQQENTIVGGAIHLFDEGSYFVALIVFVASVLIPISKFIAIGYLALSVRSSVVIRGHGRQRLYHVVEFIGRWSMIDVFVVAILSSLVRFGFTATITPGIAALSFALSVAFTMLSAQSFDPRMIWDAYEDDDT